MVPSGPATRVAGTPDWPLPRVGRLQMMPPLANTGRASGRVATNWPLPAAWQRRDLLKHIMASIKDTPCDFEYPGYLRVPSPIQTGAPRTVPPKKTDRVYVNRGLDVAGRAEVGRVGLSAVVAGVRMHGDSQSQRFVPP